MPTLFGPGTALDSEDKQVQLALLGGDPRITAAEVIAAHAAAATLEAECGTLPPFLESALAVPRPDELEGTMWTAVSDPGDQERDPDEKSDAESEATQGLGLPPWKRPTTGELADTLRGMDMRDDAPDDLDLSDIEPENTGKAAIWHGEGEDVEHPETLPAETEWDLCSSYSRSTGASYYLVGDADLRLPSELDTAAPAASSSDAQAASSSEAPAS